MVIKKLLGLLLLITLSQCKIIPTEIMFNAKQGGGYEFIELYNTGPSSVSLDNWKFSDGFNYTFPTGVSIPQNSYLVLASNREKLLRVYPTLNPSIVKGDYSGRLSGSGEQLTLVDGSGATQFNLVFSDKWTPLADGYGASMELICEEADISSPNSWRASTVPLSSETFVEYGGSPGSRGTWYSCPAPSNLVITPKNIYFSEIHYKATNEDTRTEFHEFLEFYNDNDFPVSMDNWRIVSASEKSSAIRFSFPSGTSIAPKGYLVVAKSKEKLSSLYGLSSGVVGNYLGELGGSEKIALIDTNGDLVEHVSYDNAFPWPIGPDGYSGEKYKGLSLQRVDSSVPSSKKYNWFGATPTPAKANSGNPNLPVVTELNVTQSRNGKDHSSLHSNLPIKMSISVGPKGSDNNIYVEYFVDDVNTATEQKTTTKMNSVGDDVYNYIFNGFPVNSIVKYRFKKGNALDSTAFSPRPTDPFQWHSFFVSPVDNTETSSYHLFLTLENWAILWNNLRTDLYMGWGLYEDLPESCCVRNPKWGDEVPALLGHKGVGYDVLAQYQGSPYNRARGTPLANWTQSAPAQPDPLLALSWKITVPEWNTINGRRDIYLLKPRDHGCSFITTGVMYDLARQLGLPAPKITYTKLYINGGYYMYAMDVEYYDNNLVGDYVKDVYNKECSHQTTEEVGLLYKAQGFGCEGPAGPASEQYLYPIAACGGDSALNFSTEYRTQETYTLHTRKSWGGHLNVVNLTDYLNGPHALTFTEGNQEAREWFTQNFDINQMLSYIALVNWGGAWDDLLGNHMIYQRLTDYKWTMLPWDMDSFFGLTSPCEDPTCSVFLGEQGAPVGIYQVAGGFNVLKDHFIKVFRPELLKRYVLLANTVMSVSNVQATMQKYGAMLNASEYYASALKVEFDGTCVPSISNWHAQRHNYITSTYGATTTETLNICPSKPNVTTMNTFTTYRAVPGQPYRPYVTDSGSTSYIALAWDAPNSNGAEITNYVLERKEGSGSFSQVYSGNLRLYKDGNVNADGTYTYRLRASNSVGNSVFSDEATFKPGQSGYYDPSTDTDSAIQMSSSILIIILSIVASLLF